MLGGSAKVPTLATAVATVPCPHWPRAAPTLALSDRIESVRIVLEMSAVLVTPCSARSSEGTWGISAVRGRSGRERRAIGYGFPLPPLSTVCRFVLLLVRPVL
jgi:hypothetical protein